MRRLIISLRLSPFFKFLIGHFSLFFGEGFKFIRVDNIFGPAPLICPFRIFVLNLFFSLFFFVFFIFVFHNNMIAEKTRIFNL